MRIRKAEQHPTGKNSTVILRFKHEANRAENESDTDTYVLDLNDCALMVKTDRRERTDQKGKPLEEVKARHPQRILDDLWNAEEAVAHDAKRGDRGPGAKRCVCGQGCTPRRGCRLPSNHPWSFDQMVEIDCAPGSPSPSPEQELIAAEADRLHDNDLVAMLAAIKTLEGKHRQVIDLMIAQELTQAEIARQLGLTRARVSQLFSEAKAVLRVTVEQSRFNTSPMVGSDVKGMADGANPTEKEGR